MSAAPITEFEFVATGPDEIAEFEFVATGPDEPDLLPAAVDALALFRKLKPNTRVRLVCWLEAGCPAAFPMVDNTLTIADAADPFRKLVGQIADPAILEQILTEARVIDVDLWGLAQ